MLYLTHTYITLRIYIFTYVTYQYVYSYVKCIFSKNKMKEIFVKYLFHVLHIEDIAYTK